VPGSPLAHQLMVELAVAAVTVHDRLALQCDVDGAEVYLAEERALGLAMSWRASVGAPWRAVQNGLESLAARAGLEDL
jgi:hypothetical protein